MYDLINDNDGQCSNVLKALIEMGGFCALAQNHPHATTTHLCIPIRHSVFYCKCCRTKELKTINYSRHIGTIYKSAIFKTIV